MTRIRMKRIPPRARGLSESYAAHVAIPLGGYGVGDDGDAVISVGSVGFSFGSALRKATSIAKHITDDPIVKSMLPPQAKAAIAASRKLAKAAKRGRGALKSAWGSLPPGIRKKTKGLANGLLRKLKKKRGGAPMDEAPPDEEIPADEAPMDEMPSADEAPMDDAADDAADNGGEDGAE
jgi:hypothetical protein